MVRITYQILAEEAIEKWKIDPKRVQRALGILLDNKPGTMVMLAKRDELDQPISSAENVWIVRGSKGWYFVRPENHTCTCRDHHNGHICKHRLAVYLDTQQIQRTHDAVIAEARQRSKNFRNAQDLLLQDLGF